MASLWSRIRRRLSIRLRTLLVLIAVIAIALGAYLELVRRETRRRQMAYEFLEAADAGDVPRIRRLLDEGAGVDPVSAGRDPWTPLMKAASNGRTDAVRLLLDRGANPDYEDLECFRPITVAALAGHWDIVRLLIDHGADATTSDVTNRTALDYAKLKGPPEMVRWLESRMPKPE